MPSQLQANEGERTKTIDFQMYLKWVCHVRITEINGSQTLDQLDSYDNAKHNLSICLW